MGSSGATPASDAQHAAYRDWETHLVKRRSLCATISASKVLEADGTGHFRAHSSRTASTTSADGLRRYGPLGRLY